MDPDDGVDLSPLHRELDRLKTRLCRCQHRGECLACRGFEVLRQQSQMVAAAASQPVLMQVAQEAAVKDLMAQLGGVSEKLSGDMRLHELLGQLVERVQEDLGGPEALQRMLGGLPGFQGMQGFQGFPGFPGFHDDTGSPESAGGAGGSAGAGGGGSAGGGGGAAPDARDAPASGRSQRDIPYDDLPPERRGGRARDGGATGHDGGGSAPGGGGSEPGGGGSEPGGGGSEPAPQV